MGAKEVTSDRAVCFRCGTDYSARKGNFPTSHAALHKGVGYIPICRKCIEVMFESYLEACKDPKMAVKQMCRRLDLYWSDAVYESEVKRNSTNTLMIKYIRRLTAAGYAGKSYDSSLADAGALWDDPFDRSAYIPKEEVPDINGEPEPDQAEEIEVPEEVKTFWGIGYTPEMYIQLEQRRQYWMERLPEEFDTGVGSEAIIRQICSLELDINRERAAGKNVDKLASTVANLIGSLNLKPVQLKNDDQDQSLAKTPLGVWLYKYENEKPLPEIHDENVIRKQVFTWMGHVCKMLGKKNAYTQLYEDEINKLRVDRPEYEDEDDEEFMMDVMSETDV